MKLKNKKRVPIILQMEHVECGAACLSMILHHYGKYLPLEEVRLACGVSRDGSTAKSILQAARNYGLEAKGFRMNIEDLKSIQLPAIIHWEFNHFVVLAEINKHGFIINDPGQGRTLIAEDVFNKSFTGIVLTMTPADTFQEEGKPKNYMVFIGDLIKGNEAPILFIMLTGIFLSIVGIIIPVFNKIFLDSVLNFKDAQWLMKLIGGLALVGCIQLVLACLQEKYIRNMRTKLGTVMSARFIWKMLRLPMSFFDQRYVGDLISRQEEQMAFGEVLFEKIAPSILNGFMIIVYACMMMTYHRVLGGIGIIGAILNLVFLNASTELRQKLVYNVQRDLGKLMGETIAGIEVVETLKASGIEEDFLGKWCGYQVRFNNRFGKLVEKTRKISVFPIIMSNVINYLLLILGALYILEGDLTIGMFIAFQIFLNNFFLPVEEMMGNIQEVDMLKGQVDGIEDVLAYPVEEIWSTQNLQVKKLKGKITLKNITFGYNPISPPLLDHISIIIEPGMRVAFVGGSGSGKSTLAKLISGLYTPWEGEILLDDYPLPTLSRQLLNKEVAVVDQEIKFFEGTILENITMWDETISQEQVIKACKYAEIHEDIMRKPGEYHHKLLEEGKNFSGGQKQRIEIARGLAKKPSILILDEATSALDAYTEEKVMTHIKQMGITCMIIAHRLSTIRDCDMICVVSKGNIVESGTHEQLMKKQEAYVELVNQLEGRNE